MEFKVDETHEGGDMGFIDFKAGVLSVGCGHVIHNPHMWAEKSNPAHLTWIHRLADPTFVMAFVGNDGACVLHAHAYRVVFVLFSTTSHTID